MDDHSFDKKREFGLLSHLSSPFKLLVSHARLFKIFETRTCICGSYNLLGECPCVATEIYNHDNLCINMCYIVM
jgi:hypothetical protein